MNSSKKKIDQYVNFPLKDLNMSTFLSKPDDSALYDLYAVINHYGSLNGGHYTCLVKNERSNMWSSYDDSYVKDNVPESKVRSPFAYILFYMRRDLPQRPLESVYPSI